MPLITKNNSSKFNHGIYREFTKFTVKDLENYDIILREDYDHGARLLCMYIDKRIVESRKDEFSGLTNTEKGKDLIIIQPKELYYKQLYGFYHSGIDRFANRDNTIYDYNYPRDKYTHLFKFFGSKKEFTKMSLDDIFDFAEKELSNYGPFEEKQY